METRSADHRQLAIPIVFGMAAVALAIVIWLTFGGSVPLAPQGYRITMILPDTSNLYPQSDVDISGVKVGRVVGIERDRGAARVLIELAPQYAPLRVGATAIKREKSLLGEGYIAIAPGQPDAQLIPGGGELAPSHVLRAQSLDDVLGTFAPATRQDLQRMFGGLAAAFNGRGQSLNDDLGDAAPVTQSLGAVFATLNSQQQDLGRLFANSADVLTALAAREAPLQAAVTSGNQVLQATALSSRGLADTITTLPPFLTELRTASRRLSEATPDLTTAATSLGPAAPRVYPALQAIGAAAPQFQSLFDELPGVLKAAKRGLPAVSTVLRTVGSTFATDHSVLRQTIPLLQLLAAVRGSLVSFFGNDGQVWNGRVPSVDPNFFATGVGAMPSLWNETVGGWTKRLPTNRPNPYPKPNEGENIGKGGLLAYDCRQVHNPLYLPATGGTGAPPCLTQGPWEFNGISRDYPHLTLAPP